MCNIVLSLRTIPRLQPGNLLFAIQSAEYRREHRNVEIPALYDMVCFNRFFKSYQEPVSSSGRQLDRANVQR